jgi:aminoglycoside N3'-acetyltransferase
MVYIKEIFTKKTVKSVIKKIRKKYNKTLGRRIGKTYTKSDIVKDLRRLGISDGDTIMVHSSLSRIGFVENGPFTLIEALIEAVGKDGTVLMPAYSIHGGMKKTLESDTLFNPKTSKVTVGLIPETFRNHPGVHRSLHPTHSICAYGKLAMDITKDHEKCDTTFGKGTPFYKFMEMNGKLVGIGIDLGPVTFYHVIEEVEHDFPIKTHSKNRVNARLLDYEGNIIKMSVLPLSPELGKIRIDNEANLWIRKFFTKYLRENGYLYQNRIGKGRSFQIEAKKLYEAQLELSKDGITIYTTKDEYLNSK